MKRPSKVSTTSKTTKQSPNESPQLSTNSLASLPKSSSTTSGQKDIDLVNHPPHYTQGSIECIDALEAMTTKEEFVGFLRCQIVKYTWRMNNKGNPIQDSEKAQWYLNRLISTLQKST